MATPISFIITCMGRLNIVMQTIESVINQPDCEYVFVDYSCPQNSGEWVERNYSKAKVVRHPNEKYFNGSTSRNVGAAAAKNDWLCFLDSDMVLSPNFCNEVSKLLSNNSFFAVKECASGLAGTIICRKSDFQKAGGFDSAFQGWGGEDDDFKDALYDLGLKCEFINVSLLRHIQHGDDVRTMFFQEKDKTVSSQTALNIILENKRKRTMARRARSSTLKTISITAYKRPEYLKQVLASIQANKFVDQYELFLGLEPGNNEIVDLVKSIDWIKTHIYVNDVVLGVRKNPHKLMNKVFLAGSIMNVYLEEDVIISPDALSMANWYLETQPENAWLSLNFLDYGSSTARPYVLIASKKFNALGFCVKSWAWREHFSRFWMSDDGTKRVYGEEYSGWDWAVTAHLKENAGLKTLTPMLSRSNHIGRNGGVHASPEFHDKIFPHLPISDGSYPSNHFIEHLPDDVTTPDGGHK